MRIITSAFNELKLSISKVHVFETLLNTFIVFLAAYLVSSLTNIPIIIPLSIAGAFFIIHLTMRLTKNKIREAELYYPKLNEKLRTAEEYAKTENAVVNELHEDVLKDLAIIEESEFLDERKVLAKSGIIALLCFLILLLAPTTIKLDFIQPAIDTAKKATDINITFQQGGDNERPGGGGKLGAAVLPDSRELYGAPKISKLGDQELKLVIKQGGEGINIRQVSDIQEKSFSETFPNEAEAVTSETYEEKIPKEQQDIVKNYFKAIAQG